MTAARTLPFGPAAGEPSSSAFSLGIAVGSATFRVVADDPRIARAVERIADYFGITVGEIDEPWCDVRLSGLGPAPAPPDGAGPVVRLGPIQVFEHPDDGRLWLGTGEVVGIEIDPSRPSGPTVVGVVDARAMDRKVLGDEEIVPILATFLLPARHRGLHSLHAAAVDLPDAGGVVFVGSGGRGKTTLVLGAVAAGARMLSDDSVLLSREGEATIVARGLRPAVYLAGAEGDGWGSCPLTATSKKRKLLPPEARTERSVPRWLVFPEIVGKRESWLATITGSEALRRLAGHSELVVADRAVVPDHLLLLGDLVRQCRCARLGAGEDLFREPSRLVEMLSERQ